MLQGNPPTQAFNLDHNLEITALAAKDGWVATGDKGQYPNVIIWEASTCEKVVRLRGDLESGIGQICFSRDRKLLAASGTDEEHCVALYNLEKIPDFKDDPTMSILVHKEKGCSSTIFCLQFSKDSELLFAGNLKEVLIFAVRDGLKARRAKFGSIPFFPAYGVGTINSYFISVHSSGYLILWKGDNCEKYMKADEADITALSVSHSETNFLTGDEQGFIKLWNADLSLLKAVDLTTICPNALYSCVTALDQDEQARVLIGLKSG